MTAPIHNQGSEEGTCYAYAVSRQNNLLSTVPSFIQRRKHSFIHDQPPPASLGRRDFIYDYAHMTFATVPEISLECLPSNSELGIALVPEVHRIKLDWAKKEFSWSGWWSNYSRCYEKKCTD